MNSKELFEACFRGSNDRIPYLPLVSNYAAKVEQLDPGQLFTSPNKLTKSLQNTQKLFGADGFLLVFDRTLEAEALGPGSSIDSLAGIRGEELIQRGQIQVVIEAARRLSLVKGAELPLWTVLTGPMTLAAHLRDTEFPGLCEGEGEAVRELHDDLVRKILVPLARAMAEAGVRTFVVADRGLDGLNTEDLAALGESYQVFQNTLIHFGCRSVYLGKGCGNTGLRHLLKDWPFNAVVVDGTVDFDHVRETARRHDKAIGLGIPAELLAGGYPQQVATWVSERLAGKSAAGLFLTTDWDITYETPIDNLHAVSKALGFVKF